MENSIYDIVVAKARQKRATGETETDNEQRQASLVFIGSRGSGKTTVIQRFLDRQETPRPTLALEYTYGRKSGKSLIKDVCHIWELGGGASFTTLLSTPLNHRTITTTTVVLVLDLSKPETLWIHMENLINAVKKRMEEIVTNQEKENQDLRKKLTEAAWNRIGLDHPDKEKLNPSLVPLVIIGSQYDIFQATDPDSKKLICKALRYVAHTNGAGLYFFSNKDSGLTKKVKELMNHFGFGSQGSNSLSQDYNKPLLIPCGSDSLQAISGNIDNEGMPPSYDAWKQAFTVKFPQQDEKKVIVPEDPSIGQNYAELVIDNLRSQKEQELEYIRREVSRRIKYDDLTDV